MEETQLKATNLTAATPTCSSSPPEVGSPQVFFGVTLLPFPMLSPGPPPLEQHVNVLGLSVQGFLPESFLPIT